VEVIGKLKPGYHFFGPLCIWDKKLNKNNQHSDTTIRPTTQHIIQMSSDLLQHFEACSS